MNFSIEKNKQRAKIYINNIQKTFKRLNKKRVFGVAAVGLALVGLAAYTATSDSGQEMATALADAGAELGALPVPSPSVKYGFITDDYEMQADEIKNGEFLSNLLTKFNVPYTDIDKLVKKSEPVFDVRKMRSGNAYMMLSDKQSKKPLYFIYEPSPYDYVVYDLRDTMSVRMVQREVTTETVAASGVVTSSLWDAITDNNMSYEVAAKMEQALAWSVDFHHIQKNDRFKLIYDQNFVEGKPVGVGQLQAVYFQQGGQDYYAFHFKTDDFEGFYDEEGRPAKKAFLKAPVEYARISSGYNLRRFHPILRRVKAHLGTDYAAPYGTPIIAVADGTVTESRYGGGNGNFVKLRHDKVYETQYLHMSKRAVQVGQKVRQGQVIGYVGSTGLATGPHVCYRFWKDGKQVNPLNEKLPRPEPLPIHELARFNGLRDSLTEVLAQTPFLDQHQQRQPVSLLQESNHSINP